MVFERPHPTHYPRRPRPAHALVAVGLLSVLLGCTWFLARRCHRLEVAGRSMLPSFAPGDRVVAVEGLPVRAGDVVAIEDPRDGGRLLVKRVHRVAGGTVEVLGDNDLESTDSRTFGQVSLAAIRGRVVYRYFPPERAGLLP